MRTRPGVIVRHPMGAVLASFLAAAFTAAPPGFAADYPYTVLGFNDLGMHCMNQDNSELMLLPPYNNLHAQVIRRGGEPHITTSGVTVQYTIPANRHSADKDNF